MLKYRTFGYGHSFGVLSHYYGREAGLELREDIDTVLEPGMVVSMEVSEKKHLYIYTGAEERFLPRGGSDNKKTFFLRFFKNFTK